MFIEKAEQYGLVIEDFNCRPAFKKYLESLTIIDMYELYIYNRYIIVKSINNEVCVTILNLPKEYYSTVESVMKKKRSEK